MNMDKAISVSCVIDKLLPSWKDFKHTLKHKKEELTLVELGDHLRIEELLKALEIDRPKRNNVVGTSVVNMAEHNNSTIYNDNKGIHKHHDNTKADPSKKSKLTCWKCGKTRHLKRDYKGVKIGNKSNGSGTSGSEIRSNNHRSLKNGTDDDIGVSKVQDKVSNKVVVQQPQLRKSKRVRTLKSFGPEFQLYLTSFKARPLGGEL
ncbi:hypothetical protein Tco_1431409 [Tanacetum coccineum]